MNKFLKICGIAVVIFIALYFLFSLYLVTYSYITIQKNTAASLEDESLIFVGINASPQDANVIELANEIERTLPFKASVITESYMQGNSEHTKIEVYVESIEACEGLSFDDFDEIEETIKTLVAGSGFEEDVAIENLDLAHCIIYAERTHWSYFKEHILTKPLEYIVFMLFLITGIVPTH